MPNRSRQKGDRLERSLVNQFQQTGIEAKRVPLSGASPGFTGDVQATIAGKELTIEAKARKNSFKQLYAWLEHSDMLVVKSDRKSSLAVLPLALFLELAVLANNTRKQTSKQAQRDALKEDLEHLNRQYQG